MKRLGALIAALVVLAGCQAAGARKGRAEPVARELVKSGRATTAKDWSPKGKPGAEDTLYVPAGRTLEVTKALTARNITVDGTIARSQSPITVTGNFVLHAPVSWEGVLNSEGLDHLVTSGNRIADIENNGIIELSEPLHVGTFQWHGSLDTNGNALTVDGRLYRLEGSYTNYSTSTVVSGEYRAYPLKVTRESKDTLVEAMHATVVVTGLPRGAFEGARACYGSLTLEAGETMSTLLGYEIEGRWADNTPTLTIERGSTVTIEGDTVPGEVVIGPAAQVIQSSEPGKPYMLNLPYPLQAATEATVSDMHVTGSTLTLHGAHDGGGNAGIVFD